MTTGTTPPGTATAGSVTATLRRRRLTGLLILTVLLVIGFCLSLAFGSRTIPLGETWTLLRQLPGALGEDHIENTDLQVIVDYRWPRTLIGIIVGAALGVAGALIQGHTRNPLADPGILGIASGAALAVVISFSVFHVSGTWATSVWAFGGAVAATIAVFALASVSGGNVHPMTLILGGAALNAVLQAVISAFVLTDSNNLDRMRFWTVGSISGRDMSVFWTALPIIALGLLLALMSGPTLNLLNLGDDVATALGVDTGRARITGMVIIALLAAAATAAAGPISFLGLVIPHLVRFLTGPDYRWILPYSALGGAVLLIYADVLGRVITRPGELEVGIILAFVGAPIFIWMITRKKVVEL
ncbi:FecCD family ABC transporter permease [Corynebacterium terpenotabidum]|uniref:Iron ABC transport system permease n=1 Tax=Corynebacterium terpenotabidum Y-11 TaxID=1200352 RepID=S4XGB8_9CORY|nr:iron ABC transporter permease [Corynebacterium terpenotabidum]AGP31581.1 iron ABC transport system permease [Corynebacterium terpenotabidum Y-11]